MNRELEKLKKNAREAKKGLWGAPVQVPPTCPKMWCGLHLPASL